MQARSSRDVEHRFKLESLKAARAQSARERQAGKRSTANDERHYIASTRDYEREREQQQYAEPDAAELDALIHEAENMQP